jgi:hypothetical protein
MGLRISTKVELLKFAEKALGPRWIFQGMKRSGNHAVINWMLGGGRFFFINNVFWIDRAMAGHYRFPVSMARVIARKRLRKFARTGFWATTNLLSVEDFSISTRLFEVQGEVTNILLVRDPENLFASRIRMAFKTQKPAFSRRMDVTMQRAISIWLEHADELLGTTEHLPNHIGVYFDKWVSDPGYRNLIAARLGISCQEDDISVRAKEGGGSSFSGYEIVDPSEADNLHRRRRHLNERESALLDAVMAVPRIKETRLRLLAQFGMSAP